MFRAAGVLRAVSSTLTFDKDSVAAGEAGSRKLSIAELERLQRIVIGDAQFVRLGLRGEDGFVGMHDRTNNEPIPDHISARPEGLKSLVEGMIAYALRAVDGAVDPVVVAAASAFGFVYVHPFSDGNGRLHRWLIHHVLAAAGYNPPGGGFPRRCSHPTEHRQLSTGP
jgi:Fic family protein